MESVFTFITLFSLLLAANTIDARKDMGEYWKGITKEAAASTAPRERPDCHTSQTFELNEHKNFGEIPFDVSTNYNEIKPSNSFADDFGLKKHKTNSFADDFEPRPNVSIYDNDAGLKEDKSYVKDFEPRPDATIIIN